MDENSADKTTPQEPIPAKPAESIAPATPLPATVPSADKDNRSRNYVLAGVSAVVGAALVLGAGVVGYSIGHHDSDSYREGVMSLSGDRNGPRGEAYGDRDGSGSMKGHGGEYGMNSDGGMMGGQRGNGPMMGDGQGGAPGNGPMMQGNGIQDFLNQLQNGQGLSPDQQQFLDQLRGFITGMRGMAG
jgi:hypothetical protein